MFCGLHNIKIRGYEDCSDRKVLEYQTEDICELIEPPYRIICGIKWIGTIEFFIRIA